jgi:hypothetical protein
MTTLQVILILALIAMTIFLPALIVLLFGKKERKEQLSDSRILLGYPISEIIIMDDDVIITYSQPLETI